MDFESFFNILVVIAFILYTLISMSGKKDKGTTASSEELGIEVPWEDEPSYKDPSREAGYEEDRNEAYARQSKKRVYPARPSQVTVPAKASYGQKLNEKLSDKFNSIPEPRSRERGRRSSRHTTYGDTAIQVQQVHELLKSRPRDVFFAKELLDKPLSMRD